MHVTLLKLINGRDITPCVEAEPEGPTPPMP